MGNVSPGRIQWQFTEVDTPQLQTVMKDDDLDGMRPRPTMEYAAEVERRSATAWNPPLSYSKR